MNSEQNKGYLMVLATGVLWGTIGFFIGWAICAAVIPIPNTDSAAVWRFWAELIPLLSIIALALIFWLIDKRKIQLHLLWNGVGAIILGGVSLAEDYPRLFNMVISGNTILFGGSCKIEGSIIVLLMNLILMIRFGYSQSCRQGLFFPHTSLQ